jgi:hypothetical protein
VCQPLSLTFGGSPQPFPDDWASDGTFLYGVSCSGGGQVFKLPVSGIVDGGGPVELTAGIDGGSQCPRGIGIDATNAYWLDALNGAVWSAPLSGASPPVKLGATGQAPFSAVGVHGIALDTNNVYFDIQPSSGFGYVFSISKNGGAPNVLSNDGFMNSAAVAVDSNNVYYITYNGPDGQLRSVPKTVVGDAGVTSTVLFTFTNDQVHDLRIVPTGYLVSGTNIYLVNASGGAASLLVPSMSGVNVESLATDGTNVFFTDFVDGYVYEGSLAGGLLQRMAIVSGAEPDLILLDANNVYWTSNLNGGFMSLPATYRP